MKVKIEVQAEDWAEADETEAELDNILRLVASNPETPGDILNAMSKKTSSAVLEEVARNPHTDIDTLEVILEDPRPRVRAAVAKHPSAINFAWKLAADPSPIVRYRLAKTAGFPDHVYEALVSDPNLSVAQAAEKSLAASHRKNNVILWLAGFLTGDKKAG